MYRLKRVGIIYNRSIEAARLLAERLASDLTSQGEDVWVYSTWEEQESQTRTPGTELLISIGGDGTILRVARIAAPHSVPILGINLGRLGFMTELPAEEALEKVPLFLDGGGWLEERAMLQAVIDGDVTANVPSEPLHALNEVLVGRGAVARVVNVKTTIDGALFTTYKADGLIVSTATGSTGYALAAGGPIIHPQSRDILLTPLAAHLIFDKALVIPPESQIQLQVETDHEAIISVDGQVNLPLKNGDRIQVSLSPYVVHFLRAQPPTYFYDTLTFRLKRLP